MAYSYRFLKAPLPDQRKGGHRNFSNGRLIFQVPQEDASRLLAQRCLVFLTDGAPAVPMLDILKGILVSFPLLRFILLRSHFSPALRR